MDSLDKFFTFLGTLLLWVLALLPVGVLLYWLVT